MKASYVINGFGQTRSLTMVVLLLSLVRVLPDEWPAETIREDALVSTFSIVAFDPLTQELGIAVQSKFFGVGSVVPWAKAGVGAIATQSYANVTYGPDGLSHLESGLEAAAVIEKLTSEDAQSATRQAAVVDAHGGAASFTGEACHSWAGHVVGQHYAIQGNLLAGQKVVEAMDRAFRQMRGQPRLPGKPQVEIGEEGNRPLYWSSGKEVAMQVPTIDSSICAWRIIPSPLMSSSACWTCTRCFTSAHTEPGLECLFHLKASEK